MYAGSGHADFVSLEQGCPASYHRWKEPLAQLLLCCKTPQVHDLQKRSSEVHENCPELGGGYTYQSSVLVQLALWLLEAAVVVVLPLLSGSGAWAGARRGSAVVQLGLGGSLLAQRGWGGSESAGRNQSCAWQQPPAHGQKASQADRWLLAMGSQRQASHQSRAWK